MKSFHLLSVVTGSLGLLGLVLGLFTAVNAANITVNSHLDTADPTPGNGICDVEPGTAGNQCTLRAAIQTAQGMAGADTIHFASSMDIAISSYLPTLSEEGLTIAASPEQTVRINGQGIAENIFYVIGNNITISNVVVYGAASGWSNIWVNNSEQGVVIANNLIGDDDPAPGGCGQNDEAYGGIYISGDSLVPTDMHRVWIYGNIIECHTGSLGEGMTLAGTESVIIGQHPDETLPLVPGNIIRHNQTGIAVNGGDLHFISSNVIENNSGNGISVNGSTDTVIIGCFELTEASTATCLNKIRGNGEAGVHIEGNNVGSVGLVYNWIGLADDGITAVPNNIGLHLHTDNERTIVVSNTISGNTEDGIRIQESRGKHWLWGNVIGLGADGTTAVANGSHGIALFDDAGETEIGVDIPSLSLNQFCQISNSQQNSLTEATFHLDYLTKEVCFTDTHRNTISDDADMDHIALLDEVSETLRGTSISRYRNIISGNSGYGILVSNSPSTTIQGNFIGLSHDGLWQRGNGYNGIYLLNSDHSEIGNVPTDMFYGVQKISGNGESGIYLENANYTMIGPGSDVTNNGGSGIYIYNSQYNIIFPNLLSRNENQGIQLSGNGALYNRIAPLAVSDNGRLPIDFAAPGLEPNDPGDIDSGPNHLLNVPEVTMTSGTIITGTTCADCFILVFEAKGDPTADGGGGIYRDITFSDASGDWSYDLASEGMELRPVSFMAFSGPPSSEMVDSSPLSPVTQVGYGIYLPMVTK